MTNKLHNYPVKLHLRRICHISFTKWQMRFTVTLSDKYASGEASHSQDNCEAYCHFVSQMILYLGPLLQCRKALEIMHTESVGNSCRKKIGWQNLALSKRKILPYKQDLVLVYCSVKVCLYLKFRICGSREDLATRWRRTYQECCSRTLELVSRLNWPLLF
jgi:hypothetical protein